MLSAVNYLQNLGSVQGHKVGAVGFCAGGGQLLVLSQITENRKVEPRKSLIFRHKTFTFGLKNTTLRQSRNAGWRVAASPHGQEQWCLYKQTGQSLPCSLNFSQFVDLRRNDPVARAGSV